MINRFRQYWRTIPNAVKQPLIAVTHLTSIAWVYTLFNFAAGNTAVAEASSIVLIIGAALAVLLRNKPIFSLVGGAIFFAVAIFMSNTGLWMYPEENPYAVAWIYVLLIWGLVLPGEHHPTALHGTMAGIVIISIFLYKYGLDGLGTHSQALSNLLTPLLLLVLAIHGVSNNYKAHQAVLLEAKRNKELLLNLLTTELRSPMLGMTAIVTQLKEEEGLSKTQLARLDAIGVSAKNAVMALDEILDWQAVEKGTLVLEEAPYDIRDVTQEACNVISKAQHGGRCIIDLPPSLPIRYVGDAHRIQQVLQILIRHGFHNSGSEVVRISARQKRGRSLTLEVRDWGQGFSAEQLETLFEPRIRLEDGTGLGLAMAQKITEFMGGKISVTSNEGVGSSFVVTVENPAVPEAQTLGDVIPAPSSKEVNVLADQTILSTLIPWLDHWGCAIHTRATNRLDFNIDSDLLPVISPKIFSSSLQAGRVSPTEFDNSTLVETTRETTFNMVIMEDDILLLDMMADFFSKKGFKVFKAENSGKAQEHLHNRRGVDVFITDIRIDNNPLGLEMVSYAHGMLEGSRPLICVLSGQRKHKEAALNYGADLFYAKPANVQKMLEDILIKIAEGHAEQPMALAAKPT